MTIPASSGEVRRMRLNRGGNRRLNRALSTAASLTLVYDLGAPSRFLLEAFSAIELGLRAYVGTK